MVEAAAAGRIVAAAAERATPGPLQNEHKRQQAAAIPEASPGQATGCTVGMGCGAQPVGAWRSKAGQVNMKFETGRGVCARDLAQPPFVDSNKRTAFVAAELFLALNGVQLEADDAACVTTMLAVAAGDVHEAAFARWLREHSSPC